MINLCPIVSKPTESDIYSSISRNRFFFPIERLKKVKVNYGITCYYFLMIRSDRAEIASAQAQESLGRLYCLGIVVEA